VPGADAMRLDEAAEVFRSHPLDAGPYTFVAADTLVLKVRENGRVVRTFSLVDSDTKVDVNTGIVPTGRLQSLTGFRDYGIDIAELRVQLGKISEAVRSVVPQSMWGAIIDKLEELEQHSEALHVGTDSFNDAGDEPFDPTEFIDDDDEF
jgi:transposase-like protein